MSDEFVVSVTYRCPYCEQSIITVRVDVGDMWEGSLVNTNDWMNEMARHGWLESDWYDGYVLCAECFKKMKEEHTNYLSFGSPYTPAYKMEGKK
jgi:hypothetical protein